MIVKTVNYTIEAYAGESINAFILRMAEYAKNENADAYVNGPARLTNVSIKGMHNNTEITIEIRHK